jgi:formylglycine-generating enzyme required for sulfatase activity
LTSDLANFSATGLNTTNAVGCFPLGASWCGIEELSGNVCEWTHSKFVGYPYRPDDWRESLELDRGWR